MKQTAVEWLALYIKGITQLNCDDIIEQAKAMEKQQIIEARDTAPYSMFERIGEAEQYYNETYKNTNE